MPFIPFRHHFPDLADRETRSLTLLEDSASGLPAGDYSFLELFCDEPGCDCRRVLLSVYSTARNDFAAVINYGWESAEFYASWLHAGDPEMVSELKGPALNIGSPQSELAPAILSLTGQLLLSDERYVARVKRHYGIFRKKVGELAGPVTPDRKIGRNDPCPCGSGRKYKRCCLRPSVKPPVAIEQVVGSDRVPQRRGSGLRVLAGADDRIGDEVEYVIGLAAERKARLVRLGQLTLFSTTTGDAWMLDPEDGSAVALARFGERLPARILETDEVFTIEWTHRYRIEGGLFCVVEHGAGHERRIAGYPTDELTEL